MSDIILDSAIERFLLEDIKSCMSGTLPGLLWSIRHYGPACTEDEVKAALDSLVEQRKIKIMKEHYVMPEMTRSYFMRFLYEG